MREVPEPKEGEARVVAEQLRLELVVSVPVVAPQVKRHLSEVIVGRLRPEREPVGRLGRRRQESPNFSGPRRPRLDERMPVSRDRRPGQNEADGAESGQDRQALPPEPAAEHLVTDAVHEENHERQNDG